MPIKIHHIGYSSSPVCWKGQLGSSMYCWWDCPHTQDFWKVMKLQISAIIGYGIHLQMEVMLLNLWPRDLPSTWQILSKTDHSPSLKECFPTLSYLLVQQIVGFPSLPPTQTPIYLNLWPGFLFLHLYDRAYVFDVLVLEHTFQYNQLYLLSVSFLACKLPGLSTPRWTLLHFTPCVLCAWLLWWFPTTDYSNPRCLSYAVSSDCFTAWLFLTFTIF